MCASKYNIVDRTNPANIPFGRSKELDLLLTQNMLRQLIEKKDAYILIDEEHARLISSPPFLTFLASQNLSKRTSAVLEHRPAIKSARRMKVFAIAVIIQLPFAIHVINSDAVESTPVLQYKTQHFVIWITSGLINLTHVSILPDGFDMARCAQNFKLSNSTLLIQFNDSTDFDELTEPVSPLPEEGFRFCNQTELVGLANMNTQRPGTDMVLRYFRKDGHNWRKKKDGKTAKEAHEKLKVGSIDVLHCYYANGEDNENFQRRCYWMLEQELMHIVFVQYLEVKDNRISSSGIKENNSNSLSGPTSVNIDSTANTSSTLSPLCEDDDSGNRDGWIHGNRVKENDSQRLMGVLALDASFENPLARYQNLPYNLLLTQTNLSNAGLMSECAQNSKLSDSSLLIRFNDSTDFDELTEPVSPLHSFQVLRYFRKDGHNWRKKKDGETVKEAHEKLKVGSIDVLHCYYAHEEDNENFQRRCYWMLEQFWEPKNGERGGELMSLDMLLLDSKSRGSGRIEFTPTEDAHVIADCLNDLCSLFSQLSLIVTMNLQYFLREVSFFSGPALLGAYPRFCFLRELSRGSGKIEFTPTEEDAHVIADCLNDLCSLFSQLSLIVTMNLQYFLREVSFFSGPALLGETDRDNFLNPWEAKEYGLVSTVI
ncbi:hypothetical protein F2Q69_00023419 [Brassica cretica]|uniref:CG-1 domain-containing protein n=1 Tax=Brassica cretica TaxID=69181 RepID=A0A8S9Q2I0_BRACR|nr:hypothetical protein F2Q69_00023419 [Brassica cretica]